MGHTQKHRRRSGTSASTRVGPVSLISSVDGASLDLARTRPAEKAGSRRFADEAKARAEARRLGEGWEAWTPPGCSPAWFVRRVPRIAYDPSTACATYTVLGSGDEVMARHVTAAAVPAFIRRARGDASVFDDRDGNLVIAGTDGAPATLAMVESRLEDYEVQHVVAPRVVGYFIDTNNPDRALTLAQLNYDAAKNYLDPRDERAIEALAPGDSHQPLPGDRDEGPSWGVVTRLSAATQPKALVREGVVVGVGFDEAAARADAMGRSPADAEAANAEVVDASLAALSGWHDDDLREGVYLAPDGGVRRIDVLDVLPHDEGTPNDPRWATDEGADWDDEEAAPAAPVASESPEADPPLWRRGEEV